MAEYDLPDGPRQLFEAVHAPLARAFGGEDNIRFGGGTALAARWAHRHSTDVDLFVGNARYREFRWNTGGRFTLDLTTAVAVDTVRGTSVPLETNAEILGKKLLFRMARDQEILARDLYDIAVARQRDPASLRTVLKALRNDQLNRIIRALEDHAEAGHYHEIPLVLRPADPLLAEESPAIVHRIVRDELRQPSRAGPRPEARA